MGRQLICAVLTNVPAPYRLPMWDALAATGLVELHVIYCAEAHIDPSMDGRQAIRYQSHFLSAPYVAENNRFSHADLGVWRLLSDIAPEVVVTTGFIWTYLFAFAWAKFHGVPHVAMTDGTPESESGLSWAHRVVRRLVFTGTKAFVGASDGSRRLYALYGVSPKRCFKAALCVRNESFEMPETERPYDLMYSGRFVAHKNPIFALDVAQAVAQRLGRRVRIRVLGQGPLEAELHGHARALEADVDVTFSGYLPQAELPRAYRSAKVFLFPTLLDPWGVVANEACAAGTVCVVSPHAGVAGELIVDDVSGQICPLTVSGWADRVSRLLRDPALWSRQSAEAKRMVQDFNFDSAAQGMLEALQCARTCL